MSLSELTCRHAKPQNKPYKLADSEGMYLDVRPTGKKFWRLRYYYLGKEKVYTIGNYPKLGLVKAREKRDVAKEALIQGIDPSAQKKEDKHLAKYKAAQTFELVASEWHERYKDRWSDSHANNLIYRLKQNIFPALGGIPIDKITPPMVLACVQKIEDRKKHELAKRVLQITGQVFRYAVTTGRLPHDITRDLRGALRGHVSQPFASIEIDDLPIFIQKLRQNDARLYRQTILAMEFMLLTFVRTGELIGARWSEINIEKAEWNIPAERMKMRLPHHVPLSKQSIAILMQLQELNGLPQPDNNVPDYVFPSMAKPRRHMSNTALLMAIRRLGYYRKMTGHGFRSLAMSAIKEKLGYQHEVVDRQLAHLPRSKIDRAYDRAKFLPQRKQMMQDWSDYIDKLSLRN